MLLRLLAWRWLLLPAERLESWGWFIDANDVRVIIDAALLEGAHGNVLVKPLLLLLLFFGDGAEQMTTAFINLRLVVVESGFILALRRRFVPHCHRLGRLLFLIDKHDLLDAHHDEEAHDGQELGNGEVGFDVELA